MIDFRTVLVRSRVRWSGIGLMFLLASLWSPVVGWADDKPAPTPSEVAEKIAEAVTEAAVEAVAEEAVAEEGEAADAKPEKPAKPKPAANPLGQIFRGIFGQKPPQKIIPQNKNTPNAPPQQTRPAEAATENDEEEDETDPQPMSIAEIRERAAMSIAAEAAKAEGAIKPAVLTTRSSSIRG